MLKIDLDINAFIENCDKAKDKVRRFAAETLQDINQAVVENTPVDTGFLRGSWYAGLNDEPDAGGGPADAGGGAAVARLNLTLADLQIGDVYYAVNGANYAAFVEYGTSKMPPRAFVGSVVNNATVYAEAAAARIAAED